MGLVQTPHYHLECNGPSPTPFRQHCPAQSESGWDQGEMEKAALSDGWVVQGRSAFCPKHAPAATGEKPARKPRSAAPDLQES